MDIRRRIEQMELKTPDLARPDRDDGRPCVVSAIRALDELIGRLDGHVRVIQNDPEAFFEGYDDAHYGETIKEHSARVDALLEEVDAWEDAWRRSHRPELVGRPNELEDRIAELRHEIAALEGEGEGTS